MVVQGCRLAPKGRLNVIMWVCELFQIDKNILKPVCMENLDLVVRARGNHCKLNRCVVSFFSDVIGEVQSAKIWLWRAEWTGKNVIVFVILNHLHLRCQKKNLLHGSFGLRRPTCRPFADTNRSSIHRNEHSNRSRLHHPIRMLYHNLLLYWKNRYAVPRILPVSSAARF